MKKLIVTMSQKYANDSNVKCRVNCKHWGLGKKNQKLFKINIQGDKPMFADFLAGVH